jgi:hypothetical protein
MVLAMPGTSQKGARMRLKSGLVLLALGLATMFWGNVVRADTIPTLSPVELVSSEVTSDALAQTVTFSLHFDRAPDLQTYNAYTNAADEFAIDILNQPLDYAVLSGCGGEDLRILSSQYRITDSLVNYGRVATPAGFAAITTPRFSGSLLMELVPFSQVDSTVTIISPWASLHETDGLFEATLETYRYGAWSGQTIEIGTAVTHVTSAAVQMSSVPEPASAAIIGTGLSAWLLGRRRRSGGRSLAR